MSFVCPYSFVISAPDIFVLFVLFLTSEQKKQNLTGFAIGITLTAQFDLFLALPLKIYFPYVLFFTVLAMSIVVAMVGSWLPIRALRHAEIAQVIKGA